jgi:hypothetical protein
MVRRPARHLSLLFPSLLLPLVLQLRGRSFQARGAGPHPTLLLIPGWPGNPKDVPGMGERLIAKWITNPAQG